jgi:hypothetical protein
MAIYPVTNAYVINKDAVVGSTFKAGMILMTNSAGKVVPADSQALIFKTINEKQLAIIGVAAGDYNISGNTIIVPDYIGSNYLDSNSNFVSASDREFLSIRRQLLDYADETVNEYYNINYSPKPFRTGIGVYSLSGESFITDQFSPVLHGDYGLDSTVIQSLNPGDLLTFGGGINAGKLVKINTNSFGPDVLVIGIVDRYNSTTGLLYFRLVNYAFSFGNYTSIFYDAANIISYPRTGTTWSNLASTSYNMSLVNGPTYSSANSGEIAFDGSDDNGISSGFSFTNFTMEMFVNVYQLTGALAFNRIVQTNSTYLTVIGQSFYGPLNTLSLFDSATGYNNTSYIVPLGQYIHLTLVRNGTTHEIFVNGVSVYSASLGNATMTYVLLADGGGNERTRSTFGYFKIYNKALTATEVLNQFNFNKYRYGL